MPQVPRDRTLWAPIFIGPAVWFTSMIANFALAPWACTLQWKPALFVVSAVAFAICAISTLMAWGEWRQLGREGPGDEGGAIPRSRMLAFGGVLASGVSVLLIVAQAIVEAGLGACA